MVTGPKQIDGLIIRLNSVEQDNVGLGGSTRMKNFGSVSNFALRRKLCRFTMPKPSCRKRGQVPKVLRTREAIAAFGT